MRFIPAAALAVLLSVSACSGSDTGSGDNPASSTTPSAKPSVAPYTSLKALVDGVTTAVKTAKSVHTEATMEGTKVVADYVTETSTSPLTFTLKGDEFNVEARSLGGTIYARATGPEASPWQMLTQARLDALKQNPPTGGSADPEMVLGTLNMFMFRNINRMTSPHEFLATVAKGEFAGAPTAEQVAGVTAQKYSGTVTEAGEKAPWSLWVGPDGLPVQQTIGEGDELTTVTHSKWGAPVTVTAPTGTVKSLF